MDYLQPTGILSADGVRDGGSHFLMYESAGKHRYLLLVQVKLDEHMRPGGYEKPRVSCEAIGFARELTWQEARVLGAALESLGQKCASEGSLERLKECLSILQRGAA